MQAKRSSWTASMLVLVVVALASAGSAGAVQRFTDPAGDAAAGPDVRSVGVSDRAGVITFTFNVTHLLPPAATGKAAGGVITLIDANKDGKVDYTLYFQKDVDGLQWAVMKGKSNKTVPLSPVMHHVASGDTYTFTFGSADLGGTLGLAFSVSTAAFDEGGQMTDGDMAPDSGAWTYDLTSIKPSIGTPTASPVAPVAGKVLTVTMPVTRSDTGARLTPAQGAKLTIDPSIGGVPVKHVDVLKGGSAVLHLTVPPKTTGKQLKVVVQVGLGAQTAHTVTSWKIA